MDVLQIGILFLAIGGLIWLIIRLGLYLLQNWRLRRSLKSREQKEGHDAVILLEKGGRVYSVNQVTRDLLGISNYEPVTLNSILVKFSPQDQFLNLCVNEGLEQLTLDGVGLVEVHSNHLLVENKEYQVLYLSRVELMEEIAFKQTLPEVQADGSETMISRDALDSILDIAESIHQSFSLDETVRNILYQFNRFIPSEFAEITLLELDSGNLRAFRLMGRHGEGKTFRVVDDPYKLDGADISFATHLFEIRSSLLINRIPLHKEYQTYRERVAHPFNSYLGAPLFDGDGLVGTISFGMLKIDTYTEGDRRLLEAFSHQIGVALANAQSFEARNQLANEQNIAAKFNEVMQMEASEANLYERLVTSIVDLLDVDLLGFLIYDADWTTLDAQFPFYGLSEQLVELYQVNIDPRSQGARLIRDREELVFHQAPQDPVCRALGIDHLARAAGLQDMILLPLVTRGRFFGYIQAAWHRELTEVELDRNLRLLRMIVQQAAPAIENRLLIDSNRERAVRAETLQDIAALANEASNIERFQQQTLDTLMRLMDANVILLFKFDKDFSSLRLEEYRFRQFEGEINENSARLPIQDSQFAMTVTARLQTAYTNDIHEQLFYEQEDGTQLLPFYLNLFEQMDIRSGVGAPISIRGNGIGEIWVLSLQPRHFRPNDLRSLQTAADHLAGFLDRMNLYAETDFSLRKQVEHLTILRRITNELSTTLDFDNLMEMLNAQAMRITNVTRGTFLLYDLKYFFAENPRVQKYVGEAPEELLEEMEAQALLAEKPVYYADLKESHPHIVEQLGLSALVFVPVFYQERPAGMLVLKSEKPHHFDDLMLEVMESLSAQAAIAIGNAIQYDRQNRRGVLLRRELATLENLRNCFTRAMRSTRLEEKLYSAALSLQQTTPFKLVAVSRYNPEARLMHRQFVIGELADGDVFINEQTHTWEELDALLNEELLISNSYYITTNRAPVVIEPVHMETLETVTEDQKNLMAWRSGEIFLNILRDEQGNPLGMIQLDTPEDGYRPDQPAMDALELFGSFMEYLLRSDETLQDTQEALSIVQNALAEKEQQIAEYAQEKEQLLIQTSQTQALVQRMSLTINMNEYVQMVVSALTNIENMEIATHILANEMRAQLDCDVVLIAGYIHGEAHLVEAVGDLPSGVNFESMFGQRNPLREVLLTKQPFILANADVDHTWEDSLMMRSLDHKSFAAIPIEVGPDYMLSLMMVFNRPDGFPISIEDQTVIHSISEMIGLRLSNIYRLSQTREQVENLNVLMQFSRKLSSVGPQGILDILTESVFDYLPASEGCWIVLKDASRLVLEVANVRGYVDPAKLAMLEADIDSTSVVAQVYNSGESQRFDELNFASAYPMNQDELMLYQQATGGQLPISSVFVPMQLANRTLGVIIVDNFHESAAFGEQDVEILFSMGQQAALVLENSELYQEAVEQAEQLQTLSVAVQSVTSAPLRFNEMFERIMEQMRVMIAAHRIVFWAAPGDQLVPMPYEYQGEMEPVDNLPVFALSELDQYAEEGFDLMMPHYAPSNDKEPAFFAAGILEEQYNSHLLLPLIARSQLHGLMLIEHKDANAYDGRTLQVIQAYASQAAVSLHNAFLFEESTQRAQALNIESDRLSKLNEFALQIGGLTNLEQIYNLALEHTSDMLDVPVVSIIQVSRFDHLMLVAQRPEYSLSFMEELSDIPLLAGLRQSRADYYIPDTQKREDLGVLVANYLEPLGTRSLLIVPVVVSAQFWGWIWLQSPRTDAFDAAAVEVAQSLANHIAISIVNATNFYETRTMRESLEKLIADRTSELERGLEEYEMLNNNLQAILSSMADGVLVSNERGTVVLTNSAAADLLRMESSLLTGMSAAEVAEQLRATEELEWFNLLGNLMSIQSLEELEESMTSQRIETEDGRILFVQGSTVVREGKLLGSVTILRDITPEAMAERLKSEFVTNVSHELRTPITAIKGAVEVVLGKMTGPLNPQQEMFMNMARKNCDRLQTLVDDILEVSQIDAGQMEMQFSLVKTREMVLELWEEIQARIQRENRDLQVQLDLPETIPDIEMDGQRIAQVIRNLLSNAYTYTEDMGHITMRLRQRGDNIQIDVEDTGIGIPPENAERIFERFYRGEDELVISSAGPGLGLWIAHTIVEMHNGEIWFTSSGVPGEGATFSFAIPIRQEAIAHG